VAPKTDGLALAADAATQAVEDVTVHRFLHGGCHTNGMTVEFYDQARVLLKTVILEQIDKKCHQRPIKAQ